MKTLQRYVSLLCLVLVSPGYADITIDGESVRVDTDAYFVQFDHGVISEIYNKRTAEVYTTPNQSSIRGETGVLTNPSTPIWASQSTMEVTQNSPDSATMVFRQGASSQHSESPQLSILYYLPALVNTFLAFYFAFP